MSVIYINSYQFATAAYDPDATNYIAAVETADGQSLEAAVKDAINAFVIGCKSDGIWSAIKASCILAGARTLNGALVPLAGTAPTNYNFVSGDYNRKTGLVGDGSTKYLDSNRNNNADPQNSKHISIYASSFGNVTASFIGSNGGSTGDSHLLALNGIGPKYIRLNNGIFYSTGPDTSAPFMGASRASSGQYTFRFNNSSQLVSRASETPSNRNINVFQTIGLSNARLAFYSIGESLDLALLDARVTTLINAFGAAIP